MRIGSSVRSNGCNTSPRISSVTAPSKASSPASPKITSVCRSPYLGAVRQRECHNPFRREIKARPYVMWHQGVSGAAVYEKA
jgi:hypothetical protein